MNKNKFKIFALDGPWGPSSGNNNRGSGGFSGGNNDSIDDLLKDLKNKYKIKILKDTLYELNVNNNISSIYKVEQKEYFKRARKDYLTKFL